MEKVERKKERRERKEKVGSFFSYFVRKDLDTGPRSAPLLPFFMHARMHVVIVVVVLQESLDSVERSPLLRVFAERGSR